MLFQKRFPNLRQHFRPALQYSEKNPNFDMQNLSNKTLNRLMLFQSFFCTEVTDVAVAAADAVQQRSAGDTELPHCASDGCVGAHPAPVGEGESVARPGASACGKTTHMGM